MPGLLGRTGLSTLFALSNRSKRSVALNPSVGASSAHIPQGISGFAGVQGDPLTGRPEPVKNAICDKLTALVVAQDITAALLARERGRGGQHLRAKMLDAAITVLWPDGGANQTLLDPSVPRPSTLAATCRASRPADFDVASIGDAQVHGLFRGLRRPDLVTDPRFATAESRIENLGQLVAEDVPCGPRTPLEPSRTPVTLARPAPGLGEHSDEVLAELGIGAEERARLRAAPAVA